MVVKANRMHIQRLDGRPQEHFGIFEVGIRITQKIVSYSTRKLSKWGYARFGACLTLKMGRNEREGQPDA